MLAGECSPVQIIRLKGDPFPGAVRGLDARHDRREGDEMTWEEYKEKKSAALASIPAECTPGACLHEQLQCVGEVWTVVFVSCDEAPEASRKPCGGAAHVRLVHAILHHPDISDKAKVELLKS